MSFFVFFSGGAVLAGSAAFVGALLFPPVVTEAAERLSDAVHRLAEGDGDGLFLGAVGILPGGDEEQPSFSASVNALL